MKIDMKKRKHQFHCNSCNSPCEIYKKGKGHRVLVCPNCGILATNPLPLIPLAISAGASLLSKKSSNKQSADTAPPAKQKIVTDSLDKINATDQIIERVYKRGI